MSEDKIHVAIALYDPAGTYSQHAGVVITSLFEHTKRDVIVHVLHDDRNRIVLNKLIVVK